MNKTYECVNCGKKVRESAVPKLLITWGICAECYMGHTQGNTPKTKQTIAK